MTDRWVIRAPVGYARPVFVICCDNHTLAQYQPVCDKPNEFLADRNIVGVHVDGVVMWRGVAHLDVG